MWSVNGNFRGAYIHLYVPSMCLFRRRRQSDRTLSLGTRLGLMINVNNRSYTTPCSKSAQYVCIHAIGVVRITNRPTASTDVQQRAARFICYRQTSAAVNSIMAQIPHASISQELTNVPSHSQRKLRHSFNTLSILLTIHTLIKRIPCAKVIISFMLGNNYDKRKKR